MLRLVSGNIFDSKMQTIVNTVNCVGVMGKGLALDFKKRYPEMYKDYTRRCSRGEVVTGRPYLYQDLTGVSILNFPTKNDWKNPSEMEYVTSGLDWFVDHYHEMGIQSIAFSALGCGNGGLSWSEVGPIMYYKLQGLPIDIEIYPPFGTKGKLATVEGLAEAISPHLKNAFLFTYLKLNEMDYSLSVSKGIVSDIVYLLMHCNIACNMSFSPRKEHIECDNLDTLNSILKADTSVYLSKNDSIACTYDVCDLANQLPENHYNSCKRIIDLISRMHNEAEVHMATALLYVNDLNSISSVDSLIQKTISLFSYNKIQADNLYELINSLTMIGWLNYEIEEAA